MLSSKINGLCIFFLSYVGLCGETTKENTHVEQHTHKETLRMASGEDSLHTYVTFSLFVSGDYLHPQPVLLHIQDVTFILMKQSNFFELLWKITVLFSFIAICHFFGRFFLLKHSVKEEEKDVAMTLTHSGSVVLIVTCVLSVHFAYKDIGDQFFLSNLPSYPNFSRLSKLQHLPDQGM